MMAEYLAELIQKGFIVESETKNGKMYSLTDKGYDYLAKFRLIIEFQKSFGLD
jgi:predicted transcriptional regulator